MSSPNIFRDGTVAAQPFASMLPTALPDSLQMVTKKVARGARTQQEIETAKERAKVEGFDEGYSQGLTLGMNEGSELGRKEAFDLAYSEAQGQNAIELENFRREMSQLMERIENSLHQWCTDAENQLTHLVIEICSRVLSSELQQSRESVIAIVREAMQQVTHSTSAQVRVNPFDVPILEKHKAALLAMGASIRHLDITEDPTIFGGCVLETHGGVVDARIERRMLNLQEEAA